MAVVVRAEYYSDFDVCPACFVGLSLAREPPVRVVVLCRGRALGVTAVVLEPHLVLMIFWRTICLLLIYQFI